MLFKLIILTFLNNLTFNIREAVGFPSIDVKGCVPKSIKFYGHLEITQVSLRYMARNWFLRNPNVFTNDEQLSKINIGECDDENEVIYRFNNKVCHENILEQMVLHYQPNTNNNRIKLQKSIGRAISEIVDANNKMDNFDSAYYSQTPSFHFDGEEFNLSNSQVAIKFTETLDSIRKNNFSEARELAGRALHTLQDFYSHSSWLEKEHLFKSDGHYSIHGMIGQHEALFQVAPENMSTCITCNSSVCNYSEGLLSRNALLKGYLTSGYFEFDLAYWIAANPLSSMITRDFPSRYNKQKPRNGSAVKCSHGGSFDASVQLYGGQKQPGINKDLPYESCKIHNERMTKLHHEAAHMAIKETIAFLNRLRNEVTEEQFGQFLGINSVNSLSFVIDTTGSLGPMIKAIKKEIENIINRANPQNLEMLLMPFNDEGVPKRSATGPHVGPTRNMTEIMQTLKSYNAYGGGDPPEMCFRALLQTLKLAKHNSAVFVFTEDKSKEPHLKEQILNLALEKEITLYLMIIDTSESKIKKVWENSTEYLKRNLRKRRSISTSPIESTVKFYLPLAQYTGGHLFVASNTEFATSKTTSVMASLRFSNRVQLLKYTNISIDKLLSLNLQFSVDPTCQNLNVLIGGPMRYLEYSFNVRNENDVSYHYNSITESDWMLNIIISYPKPGNWLILPLSKLIFDSDHFQISIFCESQFEIYTKFYIENNESGILFVEELKEPLIPYSTIIVSILGASNFVILEQLMISVPETDQILKTYSLLPFDNNSLGYEYATKIIIPTSSFNIRVLGKINHNGANYTVTRMIPSAFIPVRVNIGFSIANGFTDSIEGGSYIVLVATITNHASPIPLSVRLIVQATPSSFLALNVTTTTLVLSDRVTLVRVRVSAAQEIAANSGVWVKALVNEVGQLGMASKRVLLTTRPGPQRAPAVALFKDKNFKATRDSSNPHSESLIQSGPFPSAGVLRAPACSALKSSYITYCPLANTSMLSRCDSFAWSAQFTLEEGSGSIVDVHLTTRALPHIDSYEIKAQLESNARESVNTTWIRYARNRVQHKETEAMPTRTYEYNVRASCCLYKLRLALSDELGSEAVCSFLQGELLAPL